MKKTFTLLSLLALTVAGTAQTYVPFPTSNALWTIRHGNNDVTAPDYFCYGMKTGDTVLGTNSYHKLYKSTDAVLSDSEFCGGLREDGTKRVYYYDATAGSERLLFDFDVAPGDTVASVPGPGAIVDYLDSVNVNGTFRRRINFKTFDGTPWIHGSWVDGIGNTNTGGLMYSPTALPTCDCGEKLLCFQQDGVWIYHNPASTADCFGSPVDVPTITAGSATVLYPNPVTGTSTIHIEGGKVFSKCTVYNINGAAVASYNATGKTDITIEKGALAAGVYYYQLTGSEGVVTQKFVVE